MNSNIKILVVENNFQDISFIEKSLDNNHVVVVKSLADAFDQLRLNRFDLILLDLELPDSQGQSTFVKINQQYSETPIIVLTDQEDKTLAKNLIKKGAQDFLVKKNLDEYVLEKSIDYAIERFESNRLIRTVGEINRLIVAEKDYENMLQGICDILVSGRSYTSAIIATLDDTNEIKDVFHSGVDKNIEKFRDDFNVCQDKECFQDINTSDKIVSTVKYAQHCIDCSLANFYAKKGFALKISHKGIDFGILVVSHKQELLDYEREESMLLEISGDIGLALHLISTEQENEIIEEKLAESERFSRSTLNALKMQVAVINQLGEVVATNKYWQKFAFENGGDPATLSEGANYLEVCRKSAQAGCQDARIIFEKIHSIIAGDINAFSMEYECHSTNQKRWFKATLTKFDSEGSLRIVIAHEDISEIKLTNKQLFESNERNKSLVELSSDGIFLESIDGRILDCNKAGCDMFGYTRDEMLNLTIRDLVPVDFERYVPDSIGEHDTTNGVYLERVNKKKDGTIFPTEISTTIVEMNGEKRVIAYVRDFTERKKAEEELKISEEKYRLLAENSVDVIWKLDKEFNITYVNPATLNLFGYQPEEMIGEPIWKYIPDNEFDKLNEIAQYAITHSEDFKPPTLESWFIKKDGSEIPVEFSGDLLFSEAGNFIGFQGVTRDITERKNAEAKERKNKQITEALYSLSKMIERSEDEIIDAALEKSVQLTESEGGYLHFVMEDGNNIQLYKWSKSIQNECQITHTTHYPIDQAGVWADSVRNGEPVIHNDYQNIDYKKDLPTGHINLKRHMSVPIFEGKKVVAVCGVGNKKFYYGIEDIMTLSLFMNEMWKLILFKRSNEVIRESEERYRNLYENATIGVYRTNLQNQILMANPSFINIIGVDSFDELKNRSVIEFYKYPSQLRKFREILLKEGVVYGFESQLVRPDGKEITIKESAKLISYNGDGEIIEGAAQDITEEKLFEQKLIAARNKAERSDRVKSEFLAQMSHEIRTPLNALLSAIDFIKDDVFDKIDEDVKDTFDIIDRSGNRIINTIQSILNMSELQTESYEIVKSEFNLYEEIIYPIVRKYTKETEQKGIDVNISNPNDDLYLTHDRYSLSQVFQHIFDNAVKYTKNGTIEVSIEKDEDNLVFEVADTGIGINENYLKKIFEPFSQEFQGYTRPYDGCGLGLALTKKYCDLHKGQIRIHSVQKAGTKVRVKIPLLK